MPSLIRFLVVFTILCLAACSSETLVKNVMPERVEKEVDRLLQATIEKDSAALILHADNVLRDPAKMDKILDTVIIGAELKSVNLYNYKNEKTASLRDGKTGQYTISYLIETDMRMVLVIYELHESENGLILHDISFQPARKKE